MDKEKLLKKFKMKIIIGYSFICSAAFVWMYIFTVGIINPKRWFTFGFVIVFLCLVVGYIDTKINGEKNRKEELAVMPLIISIHDTVDGLKKERAFFSIMQAVMFGFGFGLRDVSVIFLIMAALSILFAGFTDITSKKIKYLENKPEGMNF